MAEVIRMPRMSDTMEEGNIVGWLKNVGDTVEPGDTLAEVETDKATMELDSYSEGVILHIAVKEGAVPINGVIAVIGEAGEDWEAAIAAEGDVSAASVPSEAAAPAEESVPAMTTITHTPSSSSDSRIKASPLAKSMAMEAGIDLSQVQGSGDNGRIIKRDIEALLGKTGAATSVTPSVVPTTTPIQPIKRSEVAGGFEDVPMSMMRKQLLKM